MAQQRDSIDLRTLEEVHRLLASSDFATAEDLLDRAGSTVSVPAAVRPRPAEHLEAPSLTPLPRRR